MKSVFIALLVICVLQGLQAFPTDDTLGTRLDQYANYLPPQQPESFIEIIQNIAKQTIQLAKDAITVIEARINPLVQEIYDKIFGVQQIAENELNSMLDQIEKLNVNTYKDMSPCVQEYLDQAKKIINNGREEITKCILTAMGEADNITATLFPYVESIATLIKNINGVIDACSTSSNPISVAICITQHVTDVSTAVSGIIHDTQEAIKLASVEIFALVQNMQGCVKTTVDTVKAEVDKIIVSAYDECDLRS